MNSFGEIVYLLRYLKSFFSSSMTSLDYQGHSLKLVLAMFVEAKDTYQPQLSFVIPTTLQHRNSQTSNEDLQEVFATKASQ